MARTPRTSIEPATAPPATPPLGWPARLAIALGVAYVVAFLAVAVLRLGHPFELEWMEGESLAHLDRVMRGLPLYPKPSLEFTPFIYPPLYFMVTAWVAKVLGPGFTTLRLVSFAASLGTLALVYAYVRGASRSQAPAVLAACLFAATYRQGGAWLDLGRVDALFLCLMTAGAVCVRRGGPAWIAGAAAGVLFALAALTKQSALFIAAPFALAVLVFDWRRGVAFATAFAALFGGAVLALERASGGWFRFYVFDLPRDHPVIGQLLRGFWIDDLMGPLGIAVVLGAAHFFAAPARSRWRALVLDGVLCAALVLTGYATRVRVGSFVNVVLPAYLGVSLAFGLGLATLGWRRATGTDTRRAEAFVALLVVAQLALLAYKPWQQVPTAADRAAGEQIVESLRRVEGEVWVPRHPYLAVMAGKPWVAHELALQDVMRPVDTPAARALREEVIAAARARRFALVVLDDQTWVYEAIKPTYRHAAEMFAANETALFWPKTGFITRPDFVWVPAGDSTALAR